MHFLVIFGYLQISFAVKSSGVDQVLTKIFQIDQKLTFNIFHILNRGRNSKIEKNIGWCRPPQKRPFLGGSHLGYTKSFIKLIVLFERVLSKSKSIYYF